MADRPVKTVPPQSLKEFWADPKRDRRGAHAGGRREADFSVCPWHEEKMDQDEKDKGHLCDKIKELKRERETNFSAFKKEHDEDISTVHRRVDELFGEIVGKKMFGLFVVIFLGVVTLFGGLNYHMFSSIKQDLATHISTSEKKIDSILKEVQ